MTIKGKLTKSLARLSRTHAGEPVLVMVSIVPLTDPEAQEIKQDEMWVGRMDFRPSQELTLREGVEFSPEDWLENQNGVQELISGAWEEKETL